MYIVLKMGIPAEATTLVPITLPSPIDIPWMQKGHRRSITN